METRADRYIRHEALSGIGPQGQARISAARAVVIGVGALGSNAANLLARAGVGKLRLVDPDVADWSNLHRQTLYEETDVEAKRPKAEAAAMHLAKVNSEIEYEPIVARLMAENAEALIAGADVVVDGTDNFQGRALLNQACVKLGIPFAHGACLATHGSTATIIPGETACLECLLPGIGHTEVPATAREVGVLGALAALIASWEVAEAVKILVGDLDAVSRDYTQFSLWPAEVDTFPAIRNPDCPVCGKREYDLLNK